MRRTADQADRPQLFIFGSLPSLFFMLIDLRESKPPARCRRRAARDCASRSPLRSSPRRCGRRVAECRYRVSYLAKLVGATDAETNSQGNFYVRL